VTLLAERIVPRAMRARPWGPAFSAPALLAREAPPARIRSARLSLTALLAMVLATSLATLLVLSAGGCARRSEAPLIDALSERPVPPTAAPAGDAAARSRRSAWQ
jgi:hypothetical protein